MKRPFLLSLALWLGASAAAAQTLPISREEFEFLGWNDSCSVAVKYLGWPFVGDGVVDEPILTRIGTLTIPPGTTGQRVDWQLEADGSYSWKKSTVKKLLKHIAYEGYNQDGFIEDLHSWSIAHPADEILRSTATLSAAASTEWPPDTFVLSRVYFSPLGSCALTVFRLLDSDYDYFQFLLVRITDVSVRHLRAKHHVDYGRALLEEGEIEAALEETRIAAAVAPGYAHARFHYASLLSVTGRLKTALKELEAAIGIDLSFKKKAMNSIDFESLYKSNRFRFLTTGWEPIPYTYDRLRR